MPAKLSAEQLDELRAIDSPTIANAIEYFTVRPRVAGYCGSNVRCLTPDAGFMLGYAVTCKGDSTTEDKNRREHTDLYRAIAAMQPLPAVVVIGDDGDPSKLHLSCHAGEMMSTTMKRVGAVGLVTNGGLRDIREITALGGFHYFGRGLVVAHGRPSIYDVGATVKIDGMEVHRRRPAARRRKRHHRHPRRHRRKSRRPGHRPPRNGAAAAQRNPRPRLPPPVRTDHPIPLTADRLARGR